MEKVLTEIQKLGFSQYESKAYIALLQNYPVTGYELSKRSGVPRSMIYEVINKLLDRGAAQIVPCDPVKYSPVSAQELLKRLRRNIDSTFDYLEKSLPCLEQANDFDIITHINAKENVINELLGIIDRAEKELWISVWEPQISMLEQSVLAAEKREVKVLSIVFSQNQHQLGTTFYHNYMTPEVVKKRLGGKLTVVTRDKKEVIIANFLDNSIAWAVKTYDPALVLIATEFIRHDIMIESITRHYGPEQLDKLWRNHSELRYVVTGKRSE